MIETTITKIQYDADGVQRRWSIPFPYADVKHISIYTKVGEEPTVKVVDNYDIDEDDSVVIYPTVASEQEPLAAGTKITIARETPETQLEDASQVHFTSKDVERGLDKLTMITQELSATAGETMEVSAAAFEAAEEAVSTANEANAIAGEAKTLAEQAVSVANDANATATAANTKSDTAIKTANDANEKSTAAVSTANTAKTVADEANSAANKANATATEAKGIAAAANTTANNADKTANEADKKADNAVIITNSAKDIVEGIDAKATEALTNSNTAVNTANSAKQTAEGIDDKATQALTNSATALETANQAKATADSYQGQITTLRNDVDDLGDQVAAIEGKIPAEATTANQLADKEFVTTITDELAADITALNADIQQINLIKWVQALPATGETKYLYAIPRNEVDKDGKKIVALYLWDGTEWRGAGGTSIDPGISEGDGIKGDYCTTYGIIDAPNGILTNPSGMEVVLKQGVVLQLAGQDIKTTISGDLTHTITSTTDCDLFYVSGTTSLMEVAEIVWSRIEPDNGQTGVLAWWNPDNKKWKFKSNDTGNVWAEAVATPVSHIHTNGTTITRIDHIGYRVLDDEVYALKSDLSLSKRPLGEVYFSQSSLATDNPGALPGWTGEYYENGKTLFPDLYNFVKAHSELQVTKAQYDNAIAIYGECPKYVVDENTAQTSLRLPKYANYIKMAGADGITQKGAGLPNITGSIDPFVDMNRNWSGALEVNNTAPFNPAGTSGNGNGSHVMFDASKSNAIYGAADTVQPAHTTLYPWIFAYNSAIQASTAQAAEFTGALTGKANTDLSNVLENIDYVVESVVKPDGSWCRKYKSHWLEQGGFVNIPASGAGTVTFLKPFADTNYNVSAAWKLSNHAESVCITAMSKTEISFDCTNGSVSDTAFWEAKGMGVQSND